MSAVPAWLHERWYGDTPPGFALAALEKLYSGLVAVRRLGFAKGWFKAHRVAAPVVIVGNLSVGGTGKTPVTIALVEWLQQRGWSPGVVSRGHGRRSRGLVRVEAATTPAQAGDEPCLIAARTGAAVFVDADRVAAAEAALAAGCDIIVSDDGLQHYRLARDLEIEVIDGQRGYGNRRLLPAGPLREPLSRARQCDAQIVNGGRAGEGQWAMQLRATRVRPLDGSDAVRTLASFAGQRVHAVAGIGNPRRFFDSLREAGIDVVEHPFPDHHDFQSADLELDGTLPVLMTEKDAIKCRHLDTGATGVFVVAVDAELPGAFYAMLAGQLTRFGAAAGFDLF